MRGLSHASRPLALLAALALIGAGMAGCAFAAAPAVWPTWDLGAFQMRAPATMRMSAGGIDSLAGTLTAEGQRIEYDFGRYADSLTRRDDTLDYASRSGHVDGLQARFVRFRLQHAPDQALPECAGVHVPGVRNSGMGPLALTVLFCAATADGLQHASAVFDSIRFQGPVAR
jgi:hypothetical protein